MSFSNNAWFPKALFDAGLKVSEVAGWQTRGRRTLNIRGVIAHHTASAPGKNAPALSTVVNGRSDLPGPLCQILLGRDGTCYIVAAGAANHAGRGFWHGITDGNGETFGIEAENNGVGEEWPERQMDAYIRLCAAVCKQRKLGAEMIAAHREYALPKGRKIDPTGIDMPTFRARVAQILGGIAPAPEPIDPGTKERPTLRRGDKGELVTIVQKSIQPEVPVSPYEMERAVFGGATEASVRAWQRLHDLVADGIVGRRSWSIIDANGVA